MGFISFRQKKMQAAAASHHFPGIKQHELGKGTTTLVGHVDAATALACEDPPGVTRGPLSPTVSAAGDNTNWLERAKCMLAHSSNLRQLL